MRTLSSCELRTPACWRCRPSIRLGLYDGFEALLEPLARLHPSRYGALVEAWTWCSRSGWCR